MACWREREKKSTQSCAAISVKFHHRFSLLPSVTTPPFHMPHCPHCSKKCKTKTRLLQHMNHPSSKCIHFFNELLRISKVLQQNRSLARRQVVSHHVESAGSKDVEMDGPQPSMSSEDNDRSNPSVAGDIPLDLPEQPQPCSQLKNYHTEVYPGAAQTYGRGATFMDEFDRDDHATMHEENLYYPWASRQEWELASFLLHSSLSMATIDQFLSLDLVS